MRGSIFTNNAILRTTVVKIEIFKRNFSIDIGFLVVTVVVLLLLILLTNGRLAVDNRQHFRSRNTSFGQFFDCGSNLPNRKGSDKYTEEDQDCPSTRMTTFQDAYSQRFGHARLKESTTTIRRLDSDDPPRQTA